MGKALKKPMPIAERAKQFLPFSAVKGLTEALEKKEKVVVSKPDMTELLAMDLNGKINKIKKGSMVSISYFHKEEIFQLTGKVVEVDTVFRTLQIEETRIDMDNIRRLDL